MDILSMAGPFVAALPWIASALGAYLGIDLLSGVRRGEDRKHALKMAQMQRDWTVQDAEKQRQATAMLLDKKMEMQTKTEASLLREAAANRDPRLGRPAQWHERADHDAVVQQVGREGQRGGRADRHHDAEPILKSSGQPQGDTCRSGHHEHVVQPS